MTNREAGPEKEKIRQIFTYLKALNEHRNPVTRVIQDQPWHRDLTGLPDHPTVDFIYPVDIEGQDEDSEEDGHLLRVRRPELTKPPTPKTEHLEWIEGEWEDPFEEIGLRPRIERGIYTEDGRENQIEVENLDDDPGRAEALREWHKERTLWATTERPARSAMNWFETLYELRGILSREGDTLELVFGDGILSWHVAPTTIRHPILLQRVELVFHPEIPEFTVVETDTPTELYTTLLRTIEELDGRMLARIRAELDTGNVSPLQGPTADAFLKRFVNELSSRGKFIDGGVSSEETKIPTIGRTPYLFARKRSLGFSVAIETVLSDLDERKQMPGPLTRIVGEVGSPEDFLEEGEEENRTPWEEPEGVLLSKEANNEQIEIAEKLDQHSSVVVQGPPGTGKTHTIANLIGHSLAHGKSILVTSHTAKALTVLREQVDQSLRSLCISVLGQSTEQRRQLEGAVREIVRRLGSSDSKKLLRTAERLANRRDRLRDEIAELRLRLVEARKGEFNPVVIAGESLKPSEAAGRVARERAENSWIPGPIEHLAELPLTTGELRDLYRTNEHLSADDERQLEGFRPALDSLPDSEAVRALASQRKEAEEEDREHGADLWTAPPTAEHREALSEAEDSLEELKTELEALEAWQEHVIELSLEGEPGITPWIRLVEEIESLYHADRSATEPRVKFDPELPKDMELEEQIRVVNEIVERLGDGDDLSALTTLFRPSWKRFVRGSKIADGRRPSSAAHFRALQAVVRVEIERRRVRNRWLRLAKPAGLPALDSEQLGSIRHFREMGRVIRDAIQWPEGRWLPFRQRLRDLGFRWDDFEPNTPPIVSGTPNLDRIRRSVDDRLPPIISSRMAAARWDYLHRQQEKLSAVTKDLSPRPNKAEITEEILDALQRLSAETYEKAYEEIRRLEVLEPYYRQRGKYLDAVSSRAGVWADAIRHREPPHDSSRPPGDLRAAWNWRQMNQELDLRSKESLADLQRKILDRSLELRQITSKLIEAKAWAAQIERTTPERKQALQGWQDIVTRMPKSSRVPGKLARYRRQAKEAMHTCRKAVPVWIMPLNRVVENFDFAADRFDLVIIDEASQMDVLGLLAYYLGERVLVVGDEEQVSPSAVGQKEQIVFNLIDELLQGIPNSALYDGKTSIYHLARQSAASSTRLIEHFRCVPEIIQFSNDLSYEGEIQPLRDPASIRLAPSCVAYRVRGIRRGKLKVNREEAKTIASIVSAMVELPEYEKATIGVVSLVGDDQAREIDRLLQMHLDAFDYGRHRLVCGNPAQFQGDERDVMLLSMVDSPAGGPLRNRSRHRFRQRINVAASRAKDQMWVVYSLDPETDLKAGDLRRRLIRHALDPGALMRKLDRFDKKTESEFERRVARILLDKGFKVIPQYQVGYYRIDLVVEGAENRRLAIECDGDRYHDEDQVMDDMKRQATLERLGWAFERIRGTTFFRGPETAMEPVFEHLERLEIKPQPGEPPEDEAGSALAADLVKRVTRRAEEIRLQWEQGEVGVSSAGGESERPAEYDEKRSTARVAGDDEQEPSLSGTEAGVQRESPPDDVADTAKDRGQKVAPGRREDGGSRSGRQKSAPVRRDEYQEKGTKEPEEERRRRREKRKKRPEKFVDGDDYTARLPNRQAGVWFALSRWAKVNDLFQGWERRILYSIGRNLSRGWRTSAKQHAHAVRLFHAAVEEGFDPNASDGQPNLSEDGGGAG